MSKVQVKPEFLNASKADRMLAMKSVVATYKQEFAQPNPPRANLRDQVYRDLQAFGLAEFVKVPLQKMIY